MMKNDVWEVVPRPEGKSVMTSKGLYKMKYVVNGNIEKYKSWFVARGLSQVEGVDYDETFTLVARYTSIRAVISIAGRDGLEDPSNGCEDHIFEWSQRRGDVH
jgi:hypothetical protein